jgi:hypothetical protein
MLFTSAASATSIDLACTLSGSTCASGASFGTVTIADTGLNQVTVSVNLLNPELKFRDLMLNFAGIASGLVSTDGQVSLSPDGFSMPPYSGLFDVGSSGQQGWNGASGYSTVLSSTGGTLTAGQFNFLAIHIQSIACDGTNCLPGVQGTGSIKVGGVLLEQAVTAQAAVPEPSTFLLIGIGLCVTAGVARYRSANRSASPKPAATQAAARPDRPASS